MRIIKILIILCIKGYQRIVSPFLAPRCRFHPTCSQYMLTAIAVHGLLKGLYLGMRRLLRCHPYSRGGIDEVPPKSPKKTEVNL